MLAFDRTFGPWFWGNLVSNAGNWLFNVVASVQLFELTGSATWVAFVSISQFLPLVVLSPWAGALSDRRDRRKVLLAGQSMAASAAISLALLVVLTGPSGVSRPAPILLAALGIGLGQAVSKPAQNSLVPLLVTEAELSRGVSLTSLTFSVGRALGPATAGVFLAAGSVGGAFVVNAVSYLPLLLALAVVRPTPQTFPGSRRRWTEDARTGLRHAWHDRRTALLICAIALTGVLADPAITLSPALAKVLRADESVVAAIVSAFGIAAMIGAVAAGRATGDERAVRLVRMGLVGSGVGLVVGAASLNPAMAIAAFAALGAGSVLAATALTTTLQRHVPDALRGRMMALWAVAFLGTRPLGALVNGVLADSLGVRVALAVQIITVGAAWLVVSRAAVRAGNSAVTECATSYPPMS